ncbi:putative flavin monooxygenase, FAD/NAD(P)-binding domain superfamily [Helianthus debilis subsp. tardiflorus]
MCYQLITLLWFSSSYKWEGFLDDLDYTRGIEEWPRKQLHSHNYRIPEPYRDQVVVVIGSGPSANDISREISTIAKEVHLSSRSSDIKASRLEGHKNIWQHTKIKRVFDDGKVEFQDGDSVVADLILHCTGFKFHFPFLRTCNIVHVDDNRVGPLYKHVFLPQLAPRLAFLGLAYSISFIRLFLHIFLLFYWNIGLIIPTIRCWLAVIGPNFKNNH